MCLLQEEWYRSLKPGWMSMAKLVQERSSSPPLPTGASNGSASGACVLWGVPDGDPASYMLAQCVHPYEGRMCATCAPGYALDADLTCVRYAL
jgi:hypothetical protein